MRRSTALVLSVAWGVGLGGTFACLLPYLLNDWQMHQPLRYWAVAQAAGGLLICGGLVPLVQSFVEFIKAGGTPVPAASPPRLVVSGSYRYVRNRLRGDPIERGADIRLERPAGVHRGGLGRRCDRSPLLRGTWPARSEPNISSTGVACTPGFPGSGPGHPGRQPYQPNVMRSKTGQASPTEGAVTWPASQESRPAKPGST
jgi:hypothetical protein